jgi:hypothetical protein
MQCNICTVDLFDTKQNSFDVMQFSRWQRRKSILQNRIYDSVYVLLTTFTNSFSVFSVSKY